MGSDGKLLYHPLESGEFRLLEVFPGQASDPLSGSLVQVHLHQAASYNALSYCWGYHSLPAHKIIISGQPLVIKENLHSALLQLRSSTLARPLWVDEICIDQDNTQDKNAQVQMMGEIYRGAHQVYAWLGVETEWTAHGMRVLRYLQHGHRKHERPFKEMMSPDLIRGLDDIFQRPYFRRLWIVQEIALANEVVLICGSHSFTWQNRVETVLMLAEGIKLAASLPTETPLGARKLDVESLSELLEMQLTFGPEVEAQKDETLLPYLFCETEHRVATDPRDRIYALLGLMGCGDDERLRPDYNLSVEEVFCQFRKLLLPDDPNRSFHFHRHRMVNLRYELVLRRFFAHSGFTGDFFDTLTSDESLAADMPIVQNGKGNFRADCPQDIQLEVEEQMSRHEQAPIASRLPHSQYIFLADHTAQPAEHDRSEEDSCGAVAEDVANNAETEGAMQSFEGQCTYQSGTSPEPMYRSEPNHVRADGIIRALWQEIDSLHSRLTAMLMPDQQIERTLTGTHFSESVSYQDEKFAEDEAIYNGEGSEELQIPDGPESVSLHHFLEVARPVRFGNANLERHCASRSLSEPPPGRLTSQTWGIRQIPHEPSSDSGHRGTDGTGAWRQHVRKRSRPFDHDAGEADGDSGYGPPRGKRSHRQNVDSCHGDRAKLPCIFHIGDQHQWGSHTKRYDYITELL